MNKYRKKLSSLSDEEIIKLSKNGRVLDIPESAERKWIILEWLERFEFSKIFVNSKNCSKTYEDKDLKFLLKKGLAFLERCDKVLSFRSFSRISVILPVSRNNDGKKSYFLSRIEEWSKSMK